MQNIGTGNNAPRAGTGMASGLAGGVHYAELVSRPVAVHLHFHLKLIFPPMIFVVSGHPCAAYQMAKRIGADCGCTPHIGAVLRRTSCDVSDLHELFSIDRADRMSWKFTL